MIKKTMKKVLVIGMSLTFIFTSSFCNAFASSDDKLLKQSILTWYKKMYLVESFDDEYFIHLLEKEIDYFIEENNLDEYFIERLDTVNTSKLLQNKIDENMEILKINIPNFIINSLEQPKNKKAIIRYKNIIARFLANEHISESLAHPLSKTVMAMIKSDDQDIEQTGIIFAVNLLVNPITSDIMTDYLNIYREEYKFMRILILYNNTKNELYLDAESSFRPSAEIMYEKDFLRQKNSLDFLEDAPGIMMILCCLILVHQAVPLKIKKQASNIFSRIDAKKKFSLYEGVEYATLQTSKNTTIDIALVKRNHIMTELLSRKDIMQLSNMRESLYLWSLIEATGFTSADALLLQMVTLFINLLTNYATGMYINPLVNKIHDDKQEYIKAKLDNNLKIQLEVLRTENKFLEKLEFGN